MELCTGCTRLQDVRAKLRSTDRRQTFLEANFGEGVI